MADTTALKNRIRAAIKANGNQEITGPVLQQTLLDMVDELDLNPELQEAINTEKNARQTADTQLNNLITSIKNNIDNGYVYAGIATPSTDPVSGKVFYMAAQAGTYTNFGNTAVTHGISILKYNGSAWSKDIVISIDDIPTAGSENPVKSGGVQNELDKKVKKVLINLANPAKFSTGTYIMSSGAIKTGGLAHYVVTDYIPVNGQDIITNGIAESHARAFNVYNANKGLIRTAAQGVRQYTYQEGDAYVRLGFSLRNTPIAYANYGTELIEISYSEFAPVAELEVRVNGIDERVSNLEEAPVAELEVRVNGIDERVSNLEENKLNKQLTVNLANPAKFSTGTYIISSGAIKTGGLAHYVVTDYIPVNGQDIITNGIVESYARAFNVYNANKGLIRTAAQGVRQYTYQEGDAYVRLGFSLRNTPIAYANYGTELIEISYSEFAPVAELEVRVNGIDERVSNIDERVSNLEEETGTADLVYTPNCLYKVWNNIDVKRQNVSKIGLSRLIALNANLNKDIKFNNGLRFVPITPQSVSQITETNLDISVSDVQKQCLIRNTPASLSVNVKPRILVIGDSVTNGYGSDSNKVSNQVPNFYWAYAKMYFEMDKIDNSDAGHDVLFVGSVTNGNFNIDYKSVTREVRAKAVAKGGAALQELFTATWGEGGNTPNPFYDSVNNTFSILAFLNNYRTMDDLGVRLVSNSADPHGETVIGSDGNTYTIGQKITSQTLLSNYDVCTPTHVFINLNHNTSSTNFTANIANVVNIVKTELPSAVFAWLCIDSTGTNFPKDYPDFDQSIIRLTNLHSQNNSYFKYFHDNLEDEQNSIYLLGMNFIQPEAVDFPYREIHLPNGIGNVYKIANSNVSGPTYHPNNIAHAAWGYELYAFIKYLISKDL